MALCELGKFSFRRRAGCRHEFTLAKRHRRRFGYLPKWCNATFNNGFAGCTANGSQVGLDVDVAGMVFAQDTIPLDTTQDPNGITKDNMDELITNLAEPFVKDPVTAGLSGKDAILESVAYKTKRQVVYDGLYYVISRRVPGGLRANSPGPGMPAAGARGSGLHRPSEGSPRPDRRWRNDRMRSWRALRVARTPAATKCCGR